MMLVSMRDTWAAYLVDIRTGDIVWTLGGKRSSFTFGPLADFQWQHDVFIHDVSATGATVTMFDDHCCQLTGGGTYVPASAPSRAIVLKLDLATHTASLAHEYGADFGLNVDYMGDTQQLANGNVLVGWGSEPYISEFSRSGRVLLDGVLPGSDLSYRASLEPWVGLPLSPPAGAARTARGKTTVYASWNGATQVVAWRVLAGPSTSRLTPVASQAKAGFETAIALPHDYADLEVVALGAGSQALGRSTPFTARA